MKVRAFVRVCKALREGRISERARGMTSGPRSRSSATRPAGVLFAHKRGYDLPRLEELRSPRVWMAHFHPQLVAIDADVERQTPRRWHDR